jgi:ATP:corrinoid adenosyltransferase
MDYLKEIKREYPKIIPNNESDWEWENEAYEFLKERKTKKAENLFKKLCLSQPKHHSGFEGLAYTYYVTAEKDKSEWFMKEAIKRAKEFLKEKSVDKEVIDEMEVNLNKIKKNEKIIAWWN